jgi:5-methylcytosine-specific restriction endonuclease McrA
MVVTGFVIIVEKKIYKIQERNKLWQKNNNELITVDHKIPKDECDDITDSKNFIECCYKCNVKKGTTPYDEFVKNLKLIL